MWRWTHLARRTVFAPAPRASLRLALPILGIALAALVSAGSVLAAAPYRYFERDFTFGGQFACDSFDVEWVQTGLFMVRIFTAEEGYTTQVTIQGTAIGTFTNLETGETLTGRTSLNETDTFGESDGHQYTDRFVYAGLNYLVSSPGAKPVVIAGLGEIVFTFVLVDGLYELADISESVTPNMSHVFPMVCELLAG